VTASVRDRDRGARALVRAYGRISAGDRVAEVGVIGERAAAPEGGAGGVTVGDVATWAEFGLGQPQRSWLRAWIDGHQREIAALIKQELARELANARRGSAADTNAVVLARVGAWIAGQLQANIARGIAPPNAQSTIDRKGSDKPLINQGQFRQAITSRVASAKGPPR
jgi:hypothetical protein